jgi:hypothetical protein
MRKLKGKKQKINEKKKSISTMTWSRWLSVFGLKKTSSVDSFMAYACMLRLTKFFFLESR